MAKMHFKSINSKVFENQTLKKKLKNDKIL